MDQQRLKELGAVYTPRKIAKFLVEWAIRSPSDKVLDAAAGKGVFLEESFKRLLALGANESQAISQLYGIEYDSTTYEMLYKNLTKKFGQAPANIYNVDFFNVVPKRSMLSFMEGKHALPLVNAIVGNPPYVERQRLRDVNAIRNKVLESYNKELWPSRLTDIYGYFLLHSTHFLRPNGRLAFIVSDTWLNMRFGKKIKKYLLNQLKIKAIIGFEERVFSNVLVRAVLLLLEKGDSRGIEHNQTLFINLKNAAQLSLISGILAESSLVKENKKIHMFAIPQKELQPEEAWMIYLKAPRIYFKIIQNPLIAPLGELAFSAIGIQTLAKNFYILHDSKLKELGLEQRFFRKIAVSPRDTPPVIDNANDIKYFILYCNEPKEKLQGTRILQYIEEAEKRQVRIRGKSQYVLGYHNLPRLKKARRKPWYNLKSNLERCDRAPIFIPRRLYERYICVWNKAKVIANENFIRIYPKNPDFVFPLLAVLNSSLTEFIVRMRAHMYGGGVYDLRPYDITRLPTLNLTKLRGKLLEGLSQMYSEFVKKGDKSQLDRLVFGILHLKTEDKEAVVTELSRLRKASKISKG
jgi:tRNA1(Val) A37 N6-methylase TrmN6